mgnify:CR=1 FL=1
MLDFVDKTLDQVALLVVMFVIFTLLCAIGSRWNNGLSLFLSNELQNLVRIVRFIGQQTLKQVTIYQGSSLSAIMSLAASQNKAQGVAQRIHSNVDLSAEPAAAAA